MDMLDMYDRSTSWTKEKIAGATDKLGASTPCDEWDVRSIINHCIEAQKVFQAGVRGEQVGPPSGMPDDVLGDDPVQQYEDARQQTLEAFGAEGALEKGAFIMGIGFVDQLIHGWDIAKATGQDTTMPDGLAETAFGIVNGRMDAPESRGGAFKAIVEVGDDASPQDKLIAYSGRRP